MSTLMVVELQKLIIKILKVQALIVILVNYVKNYSFVEIFLPMVAEKMTIPNTFMPLLVLGTILYLMSGAGVISRNTGWPS